jgi:hypothetical protein
MADLDRAAANLAAAFDGGVVESLRGLSLAVLEVHPHWVRDWLESNYPVEEECDRPTLDDLSSNDLALAAAELEEELENPPSRERLPRQITCATTARLLLPRPHRKAPG